MKKIVALMLCLVLICTAAAALAYDYSSRYSDNTLKRSSTVKTVVKNVQADLSKNTSYSLDHDGIFGSNTYKAAKEFQGNHSLTVDGEVGRYTKTELYPLRDTNYSY